MKYDMTIAPFNYTKAKGKVVLERTDVAQAGFDSEGTYITKDW